jgi:UDP-4-keto-D-QuiNAc 4-reductase
VRAAARRPETQWPSRVESVQIGDLALDNDWSAALDGVDVVVHCAARVHVMNESAADPLTEFRRVNVRGTLNVAHQAAAAGVRRFVFISSIKVNGENTLPGKPYAADDIPAPIEPYAISKYEAEEGLRQLARETGLEVVVIRSVLVYGPGVKGNVLTMMRWVEKGIPLPFGRIHNQRSMVALDNLMDLIVECLHHPAAASQTFLVSDGEDLSTTELLRRTAAAMSRPARLIPVPVFLLRTAARLLGHPELAQRLCGSLQVDIRETRKVLGWTPKVSVDSALRDTAREYLRQRRETR